MLNLKVALNGGKRFKQKLKKISASSDALNNAVRQGALLIEGESKRNISRGARSGNIQKRGNKVRVASAPGEFPKTDTGELVANITTEKVKKGVYTVGSRRNAPQGYLLEVRAPQQGGRPWLRPTVKDNANKVFTIIDDAYKSIIRKA